MPTPIDYYRKKAAELDAKADAATFPDIERQYRKMAREYDRLADWLERQAGRRPLPPRREPQ